MNRQRVIELFDQAIDLPPEQRDAWLRGQCADDAALRAEIDRLIRADARAEGFLERPPELIARASALATEQACDGKAAADSIGAYRLVRSIGQGGMGEVWLAERSDGAFEQRVAIKKLAYPTPGLLHRFRQERQILARLEHPNIARLIDGGVDATGAPYLAMEYVEGVPITDFVRERALDLKSCLRLVLQVCEAVQYAHQNLVVHRDLKPSNVFVTADGSVKLLDFGIAKVLATTDDAAPTQTVARMLTPDYAAPEQFSGGVITTATDVYALGVILYELLTGARPPRSSKAPSLAGAMSDATPTAPPSVAVSQKGSAGGARRRALRGDVDRIVMTAIAHDPRRRYASAEALSADIRRYLEGRPVAARGDSLGYRARRFVSRNRYVLGASAFVFAVCVAATVVSLQQARVAREQTIEAQAVRQFLVGVFEQANPNENQGQPFTARQLLEKGERRLDTAKDMSPAVHADLLGLIGALYWGISVNDRAEVLLGEALKASTDARVPAEVKARNLLAVAAMESEKHQLDAASAHAREALDWALKAGRAGMEQASEARRAVNQISLRAGNAAAAEAVLRQTLARDVVDFGAGSASVAQDWQLLGSALDELGRYEESKTAFETSASLWVKLRGERSVEHCGLLNDLGMMQLHSGELVEAESALRRSLDLCSPLYGPGSDNIRSVKSNLLRTLELQGRYGEALAERLRMLDDAKAQVGTTRPDALAFAYNLISGDYRELGRFEEAEHAARESLAIWLKLHGSADEADSATPLINLGMVLRLRGRYEESAKALQHAIDIQRKHAPPSSQWLNLARTEYATVLRYQHRYADALSEASEASAALKPTSGAPNPWLALIAAQLSETQLDAGDPQRAATTARDALAAARAAIPAGNARLAAPLASLARAELAVGHAPAAIALYREAIAARESVHGDPADPRLLESQVGLIIGLRANGDAIEADRLAVVVEPMLQASTSPFAADLRARLATRPTKE